MTTSHILIHLVAGFITSFLGSIPLGAINIAVARISITRNMKAAVFFIAGATIAELFYSFISIHFSGFLISIPKLELYIQVISIPVFVILGFSYFLAKSKAENADATVSYTNTFWQGLSIGMFNPLQIPFWLAYGTYLLSVGWIERDTFLLNIFILGIICGSSFLLYLVARYAALFFKLIRVSDRNINKITGTILFCMAAYQVIKLGIHYWQ